MFKTLFFIFTLGTLSTVAYGNNTPEGDCDQFIEHNYYSLCYSYSDKQAFWTYHKLNDKMVKGRTKRSKRFRPDPQLKKAIVYKRDFKGTGFNRGHLVPAGDMKLNKTSMRETFYMSNMSPQRGVLNQKIWNTLEIKIRSWVKRAGPFEIVTGPVLEPGLKKTRSGLSIPNWYYKIVYSKKKDSMIAFLMENKRHKNDLRPYVVSVDEIEEITGFDYFPDLEDKHEARLESKTDTQLWFSL